MAKYSPEQIAQIQAQADADLQVQAVVQRLKSQGGARHAGGVDHYGVNPSWLPKGLMIEARTGRVIEPPSNLGEIGNWFKNPAVPALLTGGVMAGFGIPPFGGSGGASQAASAGAGMSVPEGTLDDIPRIFGPGVSEAASSYPFLGAAGSAATGAASSAGKGYAGKLGEMAAESTTDRLLSAAMSAMAGLPGLLSNNGPSDEERAYQAQAGRLLQQQEQRTQYANPLYEATMKMAHGLLPTMGNGGNPYPYNSLNDVKVPGLEELLKQRRA